MTPLAMVHLWVGFIAAEGALQLLKTLTTITLVFVFECVFALVFVIVVVCVFLF